MEGPLKDNEEPLKLQGTHLRAWMGIPPQDVTKATTSSTAEKIAITESLFTDDTTLLGNREEMLIGKEIVKEVMGNFEEKCHDGKEEHLAFGTAEAANISERILFISSHTAHNVDTLLSL